MRRDDEKPAKGNLRQELARGNRYAQCLAQAEAERARRDAQHAWKGIRVFPAPQTRIIPQAPEQAPQPKPQKGECREADQGLC